jgi:ADP-dependent NAD(P)H-hydrate dehydratase / NAD(P)H-hydrate epimerase
MAGRPYSRVEVAVLEANAVARGVSIEQLMENAGRVVAEEAHRHLPPPPAPVGIVCGMGNNGGDGLAAAHFLSQMGYQVRLWTLEDPSRIHSDAARSRYQRVAGLPGRRIGPPSLSDLQGLPLLIDAILGTGGKGELREATRLAVERIEESQVPILSIDLPTGLGTSTPLSAKWTVALEVRKEGMDAPACGEIVVRSIGMPSAAYEETGPGEFALFPVPSPTTRKSDSGRVVIIGGGPYAGAPYLAARAALRGGADMVFAVVPTGVADVVQGYSPEVIVRSVGAGRSFDEHDVDRLADTVASLRPSAVLMGNGAGNAPTTIAAMRGLLPRLLARYPVVLDADGLRALSGTAAGSSEERGAHRLLATPNRKELARLRGEEEDLPPPPLTVEEVTSTAKSLGVCLLAKGPVDVISDGEETKVNRTHHPAMVVGGAGDVLAGLAVSLVARGLTPFQAARLAGYWLGRASQDLFPHKSYSILPTDLAEQLAPTLHQGLHALRGAPPPGARPAALQE